MAASETRPLGVTLDDTQARAVRYFLAGAFSERRIAGRGIHPDVLAAHRTLTTYLSASGQQDGQSGCNERQLNQDDDLIGTSAVASLLGMSERTVRRRYGEFGGLRPDGRALVFRRSVVVRVAQTKREGQQPE